MTAFNEATSSVDQIINDYQEFMKKTREVLQEKMAVLFKAFFDTHPNVKTISWVQYTPYFNDGDECVFSVGDIYYHTVEWEDVEDKWGEGEGVIQARVWDDNARRYVNNPELSEALANDMRQFSNILNSEANEAVMLAMFENHVWVRAHRDGFEIEEYSHD